MGSLLELDHELFVFINTRMTAHWLDQLMPIATDLHKQPLFWLVVFASMFFSILRPISKRHLTSTNQESDDSVRETASGLRRFVVKRRARTWAVGLVILGLSMGLSDFVAYRAIKVWVQRDRPEATGVPVILRTHSHSGWSFPSNHAANNFAMARTVQLLAPEWAIAAYVFALIIAFSRVYVGVHFPLDVMGGGVVGFLCASFVGFLYRRLMSKIIVRDKSR